MDLRALTQDDCEQIRIWRNNWPESTRTPFLLTKEMQQDFYQKELCNRQSRIRYWAVYDEEHFIGAIGLVPIEWENRQAEIALIVNPEFINKGYGTKLFDMLMGQAFNYLNLELIYGYCYLCNSAWKFWKMRVESYSGQYKKLRQGKYWNGKYYESFYFDIKKEEFNNVRFSQKNEKQL